mmetsp:Transcript_24186/g.67955  ORF Transcript_24186/g.67955 Transcript_24186/m.67955 type:complete len:207 (+) Transcript_24186:304-924(+)
MQAQEARTSACAPSSPRLSARGGARWTPRPPPRSRTRTSATSSPRRLAGAGRQTTARTTTRSTTMSARSELRGWSAGTQGSRSGWRSCGTRSSAPSCQLPKWRSSWISSRLRSPRPPRRSRLRPSTPRAWSTGRPRWGRTSSPRSARSTRPSVGFEMARSSGVRPSRDTAGCRAPLTARSPSCPSCRVQSRARRSLARLATGPSRH